MGRGWGLEWGVCARILEKEYLDDWRNLSQMAKWRKILQKLTAGSFDIRFEDFILLLEKFGFVLDRTRGSHYIFVHPHIAELLSIQPRKDGKAKPYQLRQFLKLLETYNLQPRDDR